MALTDFFRINLPYGIQKNDNDEWFCFNREYLPLGWNSTEDKESIHKSYSYQRVPIHTKYEGLTENKILEIIKEPSAIQKDENGVINRVFFYNDGTNPRNSPKDWDDYFEIIKKFSQLRR